MAFLDKVGENLTRFGNDVSNKTKNVGDVLSYSSQLRAVEDKIKTYYAELGKIYYDKYKDSPDKDMLELVNNIKVNLEKAEELNSQIRKAKGTKICVNCGSEVSNNSIYCPSCGNKVDEIKTITTDNKCPKCGYNVDNGSAFCPNCGEKLS